MSLTDLSNGERLTVENQKRSPLLRLPAELRNRVYDLVFQGTILYVPPSLSYRESIARPDGRKRPTVSLTATSRQIRHEAMPVLHRCIMFDMSEWRLFNLESTTDAFRVMDYNTWRCIESIAINGKVASRLANGLH
ncbi:hypothetical protein EK21DRAFT_107166 [Setomelanomma holmii]|uniref:Uncharacterized protein n=1 Tax=Setomelanomma holmii TaxID=210430 RepID=A0A9P4HIC5_9PLEO|nr:hypothetical protein EK21DRAFT_107166 [Setomelanomma holmii]